MQQTRSGNVTTAKSEDKKASRLGRTGEPPTRGLHEMVASGHTVSASALDVRQGKRGVAIVESGGWYRGESEKEEETYQNWGKLSRPSSHES